MLALQVRLRQDYHPQACPQRETELSCVLQISTVNRGHSNAHSPRSVQELRPQEKHRLESLKHPETQGQPPKDAGLRRGSKDEQTQTVGMGAAYRRTDNTTAEAETCEQVPVGRIWDGEAR